MTTAAPAAVTAPVPREDPPRRRRVSRDSLAAWGLLSPNLLVFGVFLFLPLLATVWLSFYSSSGFGPREFVGTDNYTELFGDATFWRATANTFLYALLTVPVSLVIGLGIALAMNKPLRGRGVLRAIYYVPYVISGVVIAVAGRWIFNENVGVINRLLRSVGLDGVPWQSDAVGAMGSLVLISIWTKIGFVMVVYLAGLQSIPREYLEAAQTDGAGRWQRLRYVVVPLLKPTTIFLVVLGVIESFQVFDIVYVLTGGGPGNATEMLVTYAYAEGFDARRQGYAATIGVVTYLFIAVLTALWYRRQRAQEADL
ncbi:carbohydrate ABC transporter permease [Klenkia brasiliensis]|uniref:Multiple sugar transport system permease protein n=1 Tax=Klenkia brasiliensis TaxID=333142 RepID=A0A1G7Y1L0_9ACTN|nr:sugar ABC transporter permease [Klenkia brasiliensis]SDG90166.1 multiple sugar transport system permease protein [Klenkia brasiliensis]